MIVLSFDHCSFDHLNVKLLSNSSGTDLQFSHESVVSITHKQNIICSKILICRQLFAGHVVGSRLMKWKEKIHRMIMQIHCFLLHRCGKFFANFREFQRVTVNFAHF